MGCAQSATPAQGPISPGPAADSTGTGENDGGPLDGPDSTGPGPTDEGQLGEPDSAIGSAGQVAADGDAGRSPEATVSNGSRQDADTPGTDGGRLPPDAGGSSDAAVAPCEFTGTPHIVPADAEFTSTLQFSLVGIGALPPGCLRWSVSPSSFGVFGSSERRSANLDPTTGELRSSNLPNNTLLQIVARVDSEPVASTTARYFDPREPLSGAFREVGVLSCPDYAEQPRNSIDEILFDGPFDLEFSVTYTPFERYIDYSGSYAWEPDRRDPYRGRLELNVDWFNVLPDSLQAAGDVVARPDGRFELRGLWLGPDDAQCGHVLEYLQ